jgi:hypothetical protein
VQEVGFPTLETERSAEWRGRSAAEVCTSEARKIGVPLVARQGRSPSAGLASLHQREAQEGPWQVFFGRALRTGKARRGVWWKTPRPLESRRRRQACSGAGRPLCQQPVIRPGSHVLPGFTLATELLAEVERLLPRVAEG